MAKRNSSEIPAVGYIRMSTGRQENSPARQRAEIEHLAEREGYRVIKWYEDHGLTGTESANRPEFQRLLQDAERGRFQAILLHEQSRFSREDIFDVMLHWRLLRSAGVDIVTCQRGRLRFDDLGGIITAIIDQHGAREESMKLAQRVSSAQRLRAKQGKRIGGVVFAYDREICDESGAVVRRVHFRDRFRKPQTWTSRMVPSSARRSRRIGRCRRLRSRLRCRHPAASRPSRWRASFPMSPTKLCWLRSNRSKTYWARSPDKRMLTTSSKSPATA